MSNITVHYDALTAYSSKTNDRIIFNNTSHIPTQATYNTIELQSVEMVNGFFNIRKENKSNTFILNCNNSIMTIVLQENNYYTIESLRDEINKKILAATGANFSVVLSIDPLNKMMLYFTVSPNISIFSITDGDKNILLNSILGFRTLPNMNGRISATSIYNLNPDLYFTIYFNELPTNNIFNNSQIKSCFKIPCFSSFGQIIYFSNNYVQNAYKSSLNFNISQQISVTFTDRWNYPLNMKDADISMTLNYYSS